MLIEALFAISILVVLANQMLPLNQQMLTTYRNEVEQLELKRALYQIVRKNIPHERLRIAHYEVIPQKQRICIQNLQSHQKYCYIKKGIHTH